MKKFENVDQVVSWRLCMGCGVCKYACANEAITLIDIPERGIRPNVDGSKCQRCGNCLGVCPGIEMSHQPFDNQTIPELRRAWGPVLEVWEGHAADPEIRYKGSSGGIATALALFSLEREQASGVLHVGTKSEAPLENVPVFSRNRDDLLKACGSRYAPASPCERIKWIEKADGKCILIGKPCDVAALRKLQAVNPVLDNKVGLAISIFCAGTPTTMGTYDLLAVLGVKPDQVKCLRYRGCGWPGMTTVEVKGSEQRHQMAYNESWGDILSKNVQLRCRLCPDGTGEFADISCGDPWYREVGPDEPGQSLVLVRTERGRRILRGAMEAGYIELERARPEVLAASQMALLNKRQNLFGRLLAMRVMGVPVPRYKGFSLFKNWLALSAVKKIRSFMGTLKRILFRGWVKPLKITVESNKILKVREGSRCQINYIKKV